VDKWTIPIYVGWSVTPLSGCGADSV